MKASESPEIVRGRIWLLIAIGLIVYFVINSLLHDWKRGMDVSDLVGFPVVVALLCGFLYRGSTYAKSCLGALLTLLVVILSFAGYVWVVHWNILDMPRKVLVPRLVATLGPNFLGFCVGLVYCWWALIYSESVKAFLTYQRFKHK